jgi:CheY-like chemotaxis protein
MAHQVKGKPRLLVADDDTDLREALGEYFDREGFSVALVGTGLEAIEILRRDLFDVTVLDGHMPGLSGPQVLRRLIEHAGRSAIPPTVLVSSDAAIEAWVREQFGLGEGGVPEAGVGFVPKPIRLDALRRSIEMLLARPPQA